MSKNLKKMISYYKPYLGVFWADMFFATVSAAVALVIPLVIRYVTSTLIYMEPQAILGQIRWIALMLFALVAVDCYSRFFIANQGHVMGADLVGSGHAAALSHAEHLPGAMQQRHGLLHRLRRKGVLGAVDGGHEQRRGVLAQSSSVGVRGGLLLVHQHAGGVGLRQRDAHFMVALKAQRPAEPEHRGLSHLTLSGQR